MDWDQLSQLRGDSLLFTSTLSLRKVLVLIWPTTEKWKAESTLEPPGGFEPEIAGLGI